MINFGAGTLFLIGKEGEKREIGTLLDMKFNADGFSGGVQRAARAMHGLRVALQRLYLPQHRRAKHIARQRMKEVQRRRRVCVIDDYEAGVPLRRAKQLARIFHPRNP